MTAYEDLQPLDYFGECESLLAVGWLGREKPFPTGPTHRDVYARLQLLLENPWQPSISLGVHPCELCQFGGEAFGTSNLFVPFRGSLLVCPELILHYMNAHAYQPPKDFVDAVMACPITRSAEYRTLLLANGGRSLLRRRDSGT